LSSTNEFYVLIRNFYKDLEFDRLDDFKYGICLIENETRSVLLSSEILFCEWWELAQYVGAL